MENKEKESEMKGKMGHELDRHVDRGRQGISKRRRQRKKGKGREGKNVIRQKLKSKGKEEKVRKRKGKVGKERKGAASGR